MLTVADFRSLMEMLTASRSNLQLDGKALCLWYAVARDFSRQTVEIAVTQLMLSPQSWINLGDFHHRCVAVERSTGALYSALAEPESAVINATEALGIFERLNQRLMWRQTPTLGSANETGKNLTTMNNVNHAQGEFS